ncbi:MAG: adenylate kinase [Bacteroidales bacterium]|nr:adenylate kinase [Bacteroidales bacterium]
MKKFNIVMLGAPGSGKGTQAQLMAQEFGLQHISTGELFRKQIASKSALGLEAQSYIDKGNLCPDSLTINMLYDYLTHFESAKGFILDGVPRTIQQAEMLDGVGMSESLNVDLVINLNVPEDEIIRRMLERAKLQGRSDDTPEIIEKRIHNYFTLTRPLEDYYQKKSILSQVNGRGTIEEIFEEIKKLIENKL